jgi:hypothetical protein
VLYRNHAVLPGRAAAFLESIIESPAPGFEASLRRIQRQKSTQQSVNQNDLPGAQCREGKPSEEFARPKAALAGFTEPELNLQGTNFYQVAVAQEYLLNRMAVDARQRARMRFKYESLRNLQMKFQVPVPNAILLQAKIGCAVASDHKGKTAGQSRRARVFAGQQLELDH